MDTDNNAIGVNVDVAQPYSKAGKVWSDQPVKKSGDKVREKIRNLGGSKELK